MAWICLLIKAVVEHIAQYSLEMRLNNVAYQLFVIITNEFMQGARGDI